MLKKVAMTAVGLVALGVVLSFTKAGSYMHLACNKARNFTANQVPIEFEIERLKNEVTQLVPDLKKQLGQVAEEMAGVERLDREITTAKANLEKEKVKLLQMARDLETGETHFIYLGKTYNREQVASKMSRDWESYKRSESEIKNREKVLTARRQSLETAKEQLAQIKEQEQILKLQIAELEAELKTVRLAQTKAKFQVDDSRLGEIKRSIEDLRTRIVSEQKRIELEGQFANDFQPGAETAAPRPVSEVAREIRESLEGSKVAETK